VTRSRSELTVLLERAREGDAQATDELLPLVYDELRCLADRYLAGEEPGQTLQPTALVHEAYLRLVDPASASWENRAHFFGAAARAIRRILIERARARGRLRRGAGQRPLSLDEVVDPAVPEVRLDLLELDEALERLARIDAQKARIIELRFFAGLSTEETAAALGLSPSSVTRDWRFARIWLHRELGREPE